MSNRLERESSPYLRQHKNNPVDWYPWGEEALEKSKREDKPILLSVGYSACHWCHVMAHESFENEEVARLMNDNFINIKVDREERPDLDQIYQNVAQLMTQGGGWPLTVFLTPDLRPFYGGTYFPPADGYGRPGFSRVLEALSNAYRNERHTVTENAEKLTDAISNLESVGETSTRGLPEIKSLQDIGRKLIEQVDWHEGGLHGAPKFPNPMIFTYLWRLGLATGWKEAQEATLFSLIKMAKGGIYDQLGGGFHRYSVDAEWSVPHFEKMLYDNALLLKLYSEVLLTHRGSPVVSRENEEDPSVSLLTSEREQLFLDVVRGTVQYVLREMTSAEGLFYAAQDADSEGEEGKFFVWKPSDLAPILSKDEKEVFELYYGVSEIGNFEHGATVLYQSATLNQVALKLGKTLVDVQTLLKAAREKAFIHRKTRIAPGLDDKTLVSWNGLMISGLAWAGAALRRFKLEAEGKAALDAAERAYEAVLEKCVEGQRLKSVYHSGKARLNAYLDDYAFMSMAALDLARLSVGNEKKASQRNDQAYQWIQTIIQHFKDDQGPGYYFTSDDHEQLIQRPKTLHDQAIPSGTAVALAAMNVLAETQVSSGSISQTQEVLKELQSQFSQIFPLVENSPYGFGEAANSALLMAVGPVIVAGPQIVSELAHPGVFFHEGKDYQVCHHQVCQRSSGQEEWIQMASAALTLKN